MDAIKAQLEGCEDYVSSLLGEDREEARRYIRVALFHARINRALQECTPESVLASVVLAAWLRLYPGLGFGFLAVEPGENGEKECLFVPKWQGFVKLLREHPIVLDVHAQVVNEHDDFVSQGGSDPVVRHVRYTRGDPGPLTHVYAVAILRNGVRHVELLNRWRDLDPVASRGDDGSSSARGMSVHDYSEWAKTVALKRIAKLFTDSPEISAAIELERAAEAGRSRPRALRMLELLGVNLEKVFPKITATIVAEPAPLRRCCGCGNEFPSLASLSVDPRVWAPSKCLGCGGVGTTHHHCACCLRDVKRGLAEFNEREERNQRPPHRAKKSPVSSPIPSPSPLNGSGVEEKTSAPEPPPTPNKANESQAARAVVSEAHSAAVESKPENQPANTSPSASSSPAAEISQESEAPRSELLGEGTRSPW